MTARPSSGSMWEQAAGLSVPKTLQDLKNGMAEILARRFQTEISIDTLLTQASVDTSRLKLQGSAIDMWTRIIDEVHDQEAVPRLVTRVTGRAGEELKSLLQEYSILESQTRPTPTPWPQSPVPEPRDVSHGRNAPNRELLSIVQTESHHWRPRGRFASFPEKILDNTRHMLLDAIQVDTPILEVGDALTQIRTFVRIVDDGSMDPVDAKKHICLITQMVVYSVSRVRPNERHQWSSVFEELDEVFSSMGDVVDQSEGVLFLMASMFWAMEQKAAAMRDPSAESTGPQAASRAPTAEEVLKIDEHEDRSSHAQRRVRD